jgi:protein tyrosine phosphatase
MEAIVPVPSNRARVRAWIQKLGTKDHLAFSGQEELKMLLDLYDHNPSHPIQYYFDDRFKGHLPVPDLSLCHTASENLDRNRTKENYPTDEGLLRTADGRFINASIIEGKERTYIATQHPLPSTVLDFWKMVLAEKPDAVIMLNKHDYDQVERKPGEPELVQYWPGTSKTGPFIDSILLEDKVSGGTVKVSVLPEPPTHDIEDLDKGSPKHPQQIRFTSTPPTSPATPAPSFSSPENDTQQIAITSIPPTNQQMTVFANTSDVAPLKITETTNSETKHKSGTESNTNSVPRGINGHQEYKLNNNIEYSRLLVEYNGQQHQLWHIRCGGWKDQDAPELDLFMDLWHLVQEKLKSHKSGEKHKIVIHCTGGVGRTGTFIAIDIAGQELKEKQKDGKWKEFSIEKVIHFLRKKRMNMVGSVSQYIFCHRAALNLFLDASSDEEFSKGHASLTDSCTPVGALTV